MLGIPFYVWDLSDRFAENVVQDFLAEYAAVTGDRRFASSAPRCARVRADTLRATAHSKPLN